jgi:hypothetical protein
MGTPRLESCKVKLTYEGGSTSPRSLRSKASWIAAIDGSEVSRLYRSDAPSYRKKGSLSSSLINSRKQVTPCAPRAFTKSQNLSMLADFCARWSFGSCDGLNP